ncbi:EamA family transporter [bacterium]|nr:EamA family transporter [bacterium]
MLKIADKIGFIYLFTAIICTVTSQLLVKWRIITKINAMFPMPLEFINKIFFILKIIFDPIIFISCCLTLAGGLLWIATLTKLDISYAYPITMIGFVAVLVCSVLFLGESFNIYKILGCVFIILGVFIACKGL